MTVQLAVLGTSRRLPVLEETVRELEERGRAWVLAKRTVYYAARDIDPEPRVPFGWRVVRWTGPTSGASDHRKMLSKLDPTMDAILLEDDVQPCVNAIPKMVATEVPEGCAWISFYDFGGPRGHYTNFEPGIYTHGTDTLFWGVQAIRVRAEMLQRFLRKEFATLSPTEGQDVWWGRAADLCGLRKAWHCPSLVQHVGRDSLFAAGSDLVGNRAPSPRFPGEDWDALSEPPARCEVAGPAKERPRLTWCEFHGTNHVHPLVCPMRMP